MLCTDPRIDDTVVLPPWLDNYIYSHLKASYCKRNHDIVVLEWGHREVLEYLGTYFPRSFAEGYKIIQKLVNDKSDYLVISKAISVLDFGCGTGGELVGMIHALKRAYPCIEQFYIKALDGNTFSLNVLEGLLEKLASEIGIDIVVDPCPVVIDDFDDLSTINKVICSTFDYIIVSKVVCEFVTKQQFEGNNPYIHILKVLLQKLNSNGLLYISDITSYNHTAQEWLGNMMNEAIDKVGGDIIHSNRGLNEEFIVSHSRKRIDSSKIAWRILSSKNNMSL